MSRGASGGPMGSTATFDWSFDDLYGSIGDPEGPRGLRGMFRGPRGSRQTSRGSHGVNWEV